MSTDDRDVVTPRRPAPVRRQARGRARIESILDAAEQLVADVGYDEMTTNALAARAGISPGSLYQYFGNKAEVLDGLIARHEASLDAFWEAQLTAEAATRPIDEVVDGVVDAVVAFKAERPAFWALFHGSATSEALGAAARRLDERLADRLDGLYAARAPWVTPRRRRLVAEVSVATVKSLMGLVVDPSRAPGTSSADALVELKEVLVGYLTPALAPPPCSPRRPPVGGAELPGGGGEHPVVAPVGDPRDEARRHADRRAAGDEARGDADLGRR